MNDTDNFEDFQNALSNLKKNDLMQLNKKYN